MKLRNPFTWSMGIDVDTLTAKDPVAMELINALTALYNAPHLPKDVQEAHLRRLRAATRTPQAPDETSDQGGSAMDIGRRSEQYMAYNDYPNSVGPHASGRPLKRHVARNIAAVLVTLIGVSAAVSTVVHNVWGGNVPLVVDIKIPALQQRVSAPPRVVTRIVYQRAPATHAAARTTPPPWHDLPADDSFGLTPPWGGSVGTVHESSDTVAGAPVSGVLYNMQTNGMDEDGSDLSVNVGRFNAHEIAFDAGCSDGEQTSTNASALLQLYADQTRAILPNGGLIIRQGQVMQHFVTTQGSAQTVRFHAAPNGDTFAECGLVLAHIQVR